jgi:hypothetical protein
MRRGGYEHRAQVLARARCHSHRASRAEPIATVSNVPVIAHSARPLPASGSMPNRLSIHVGQIAVQMSSDELTRKSVELAQKRGRSRPEIGSPSVDLSRP